MQISCYKYEGTLQKFYTKINNLQNLQENWMRGILLKIHTIYQPKDSTINQDCKRLIFETLTTFKMHCESSIHLQIIDMVLSFLSNSVINNALNLKWRVFFTRKRQFSTKYLQAYQRRPSPLRPKVLCPHAVHVHVDFVNYSAFQVFTQVSLQGQYLTIKSECLQVLKTGSFCSRQKKNPFRFAPKIGRSVSCSYIVEVFDLFQGVLSFSIAICD